MLDRQRFAAVTMRKKKLNVLNRASAANQSPRFGGTLGQSEASIETNVLSILHRVNDIWHHAQRALRGPL